MTGPKATESRVTPLDQARLLLARAKAQKAAKAAATNPTPNPAADPAASPTAGAVDLTADRPTSPTSPSPTSPTSPAADPAGRAADLTADATAGLADPIPDPGADPAADHHPPTGAVRLATVASFDPDLLHQPEPVEEELRAAVGSRQVPPVVRLRRSPHAALVQQALDTARVQQVPHAARVQQVPQVARVRQALDTAEVERELPTHPAVRELLAGAGLRGGSAYSVRGSAALVMALMAGPSADGAWCGVVGVPSFGAEAARGLGVDLERLVLVPDPGREWLSVVAALVDALTVVVVRPPGEVTPGEASRLAARLRTRGAMLIAYGSWPGSEARFEIESSTWRGLGDGEGLLTARRATVAVSGRRAAVRARKHELWLPAPDGEIRTAEPTAETPAEDRPATAAADSWAGARRTHREEPTLLDDWDEQVGAVG